MKSPIYLDYSATTPCDPRVVQRMLPFFTETFGNAASRSHAFGWTAEAAVEEARSQVALLIGAHQKEILWKLLKSYTGRMPADIGDAEIKAVRQGGIDKVHFAYNGGTELGEKHSYRVQGPTFLIEFDNTQNDGNHVHSIWRDFKGDFGRDLLREHIKTAHAGGQDVEAGL